jgi:riboflavin transporter FmnP
LDSKKLAFIAMMGALGNIIFLITHYIGPLAPGVSFDLSLITTFIAAFYGGPLLGLVTGAFVGLFPGIYFGPLGSGQWLGLIGLPVGKALTGLACGILARKLDLNRRSRSSLLAAPTVLISYIPECFFTIAYFMYLMPYFLGVPGSGILIFVIPKAWAEVVVMSVLMAALVGNQGFRNFIERFFNNPKSPSRVMN